MGDLQVHSGAVAGAVVAAAGAAMGEVDERLQALLDDVVRLAPFQIGHKADAAGVALEGGIIKALLVRQSVVAHASPCVSRASTLVQSSVLPSISHQT